MYPDELKEKIIAEIKKGRTPKEISVELAEQNITNSRGKIIDRKAINNIVTHYKKNKANMSKDNKGGSLTEKNGKWRFRKIVGRKIIVNKAFDSKQEAEEFRDKFLANLGNNFEPQEPKKKRGRPIKVQEPKLTKIPMGNINPVSNDKGFVIIVGKDSSILNDILTRFDF